MLRRLFILFTIFLVSCNERHMFRFIGPSRSGINFENRIIETDTMNAANYEYIFNGAGIGVADLNNDGLSDLVFAGNQVTSRIYLNEGNFRFRDITSNFEGLNNKQWYSGVAITDINSDGWPDVYLVSTANKNPEKCRNRLWINQGCVNGSDPYFKEMAETYGIADTSQSVTAGFFDYDLDGNLDLYILNNTLNKRMDAFMRHKINDGTAPNNDKLYRNTGDGRFTDVTLKSGIRFEGFGLGLAFSDIDNDGFPDIYVSNDFSSNDLLYINRYDGTFRNEIARYISYQSKASMGNDIADINNDGWPDICTLDMMPDNYTKRKQTTSGFSYMYYLYEDRFGYERQYVRNMLHINNGTTGNQLIPFSEVGQMSGIAETNWSWAPLFADYDNDGDKDLLISNGYPHDLTDKDWTKFKTETATTLEKEREAISLAPEIRIPKDAYENIDGLHFRKVTRDWFGDVRSFSSGAVFADLDNDGDLDYVVSNINDKAFLFRNMTAERSDANHFIKIKLKGVKGNTMAIGARVELWTGGKMQMNEHFFSRGYASSVDPVIHFGLGKNIKIDSIRVRWPASLRYTVLSNITADRVIEIDENTESSSPAASYRGTLHTPMFMADTVLFKYTHLQNDFVDFFLDQKIIPHKFSQTGPVLAKGDINGDGEEEIIAGSTNIQPTTGFVKKGERYTEAKIDGISGVKGYTESSIAVSDFNRDGKNDIVTVSGGYENLDQNGYRHYLYTNSNGRFLKEELPVAPFPASVVKVCDFNHDGWPDLFIGARIRRGMFPFADSSRLMINDKGTFRSKSCLAYDMGMVTDAIWSNFDNDGWEDLLVVREWGPIGIFRNNNGKEIVRVSVPPLDSLCGLWYSVIAGDFDGNGYEDYIIGNLGQNSRFTASAEFPMRLYALDIDLNGIIDPLISGYWTDPEGVIKEYPLNYLDELQSQLRWFSSKFKTYRSFSLATMDDIMGMEVRRRLLRELSVNTLSSYVMWNDGGKFTLKKLPEAVQVAPVTRMIVHDLNGDGYPDIILAGNDYSWDVSTGYFDALKGLVLLSRGKERTFNVVTPSESGMILDGMAGSLLWIDGHSPSLIAGMNRNKAVVYRYLPQK